MTRLPTTVASGPQDRWHNNAFENGRAEAAHRSTQTLGEMGYMSNIEWILLAMIIGVISLGGYYQLQVLAHSKPGRLLSLSMGGWIFHPEDIEEGGHTYRKKLLILHGVSTVIMVALWVCACGIWICA